MMKMYMRIIFVVVLGGALMIGCSKKNVPSATPDNSTINNSIHSNTVDTLIASSRPVSAPLEENVAVVEGQAIYSAKCGRCHELKK
jgi:hypothetical protein